MLYLGYAYVYAYNLAVQYFRFDEHGDLFVFEPGSGFSGLPYKVQQGFEMKALSQNYDTKVVKSEVAVNVTSTGSELLSQKLEKSGEITQSAGAKRLLTYYNYSL